jgi:hypothetical protein
MNEFTFFADRALFKDFFLLLELKKEESKTNFNIAKWVFLQKELFL